MCWASRDSLGKKTESFALAQAISGEIANVFKLKNRGVTASYDAVTKKVIGRELPLLRDTKNIAVISEGAFMSNKKEFSLLDADLDGFNELVGATIWRAWAKTYVSSIAVLEPSVRNRLWEAII